MPDAVQRGLPGVAVEEAALPSEAVVDGVLLSERRREAMRRVRAALGECPEGFAPEEWRVVVAALAPAPVPAPGTASTRAGLLARARDCFPGLAAPAAARLYREVLARPHVAAALDDLRALELLDVLEQRGMVREALQSGLALHAALTPDLAAEDPSGAAKLLLGVVAAAKALMDLDGLRARAEDEDAARRQGGGQDVGALLAEKVGRVMADLGARAASIT